MTLPAPRTRLIEKQGDGPVVHTANRETDARTALTRGLKEYIELLSIAGPGGRDIRFNRVFDTWAEPEVEADYPSAVVYATSPGTYDASKFTPTPNQKQIVPAPDGRLVVSGTELVQDIMVEVWCTDPVERQQFGALCEAAFNPTMFMYGFILELPHYYNARAVFELVSMQYVDSEEEAVRRYRRVIFTLKGQVPVINLFSAPLFKPILRMDGVGPDVVVTVSTEVE